MDKSAHEGAPSGPHAEPSARREPAVADDRYVVPALVRGLNILQVLSAARSRLTLSEVAGALGVTRSSAYRLLYTLEHLGFVVCDVDTKTYALGSRVLELGYSFLASRELVEVAMPHLVRLRDRTGWSAHLGELQGRDVVYLARVPTRRSIASNIHVGTRLPARATTMGRILLSGLDDNDIRELYRDELFGPFNVKVLATIGGLLEEIAADRANGVVVQNSGYEPGRRQHRGADPGHDRSDRRGDQCFGGRPADQRSRINGPLKTEVLAAAEAISRDLGRKPKASETDAPPAQRPRDSGTKSTCNMTTRR